MKKILFFIAIASFSTFGFTSCSEDDAVMEIPTPNPNPNVGQQLKVSTDATYIESKNLFFCKMGDTLRLKAFSGTMEVTDATFFVDDIAIDSTKYVQYSISEILVHARRAGYIDSEKIRVQIAQKPY